MSKKMLVAALVAVFVSGAAAAHDFRAGSIAIGHPWSLPTPPGAPVASGYVTLKNEGASADRLIEVRSDIAAKGEIHRSAVTDGVASMRPVDGIDVEPGATVDFQAEKLHVMFIKPERPLKEGDRFPATLVFEKAGTVDVQFVVQRRKGGPAATHSGHGG